MSRLIEDMLGDYIYVTKDIVPNMAIFYRDKKILKQDKVSDMYEYSKSMVDKIGKSDNPLNEEFEAYADMLYEVVIDANGIKRFSIDDGKVRWMGVKND